MAGQSLVPALMGKSIPTHKALFWEYTKNKAVREGDWKLVQSRLTKKWELYNIKTDRGETKNLILAHPERAKNLEILWNEWFKKASLNQPVENNSVIVDYPQSNRRL